MTLAELRAALGAIVVTDELTLDAARADQSGYRSPSAPLAIVVARSIDDVQRTLRFASTHRIGVVTRGAGTGLAAGATAAAGELVLDTSRMDRILELSAADELAVVEPGVVNGALSRAAHPHGLWFAPDPASREISTIGGNIATGAGGLLCAKYGVTRDAVLGLKVVTADGELHAFGHRTVKGVAGLDLTALMVGSEGTLGVIVEATVRLRPLPVGPVCTISAWFTDVRTAAEASAAISAARIRPAVMELLDARAVAWIAEHLSAPFDSAGRDTVGPATAGPATVGPDTVGLASLIVQTDGAASVAEAEAAVAIIRSLGGRVESTSDAEEGERLLGFRRAFHPAMAARGTVLIEDVAVPRSELPRMFDSILEIERRYSLEIPTVAHAGDGNLHPNFVVAEAEIPEIVWQAAGDLFAAAIALGGTLTGEHGVGLLKRRWLAGELGEAQLGLQHRIKAAFDPLGILNPGKGY